MLSGAFDESIDRRSAVADIMVHSLDVPRDVMKSEGWTAHMRRVGQTRRCGQATSLGLCDATTLFSFNKALLHQLATTLHHYVSEGLDLVSQRHAK